MMIAAIVCCAMTTTVFTSCGSDDDDDDPPAERKVVGYQVDYNIVFPESVYASSAQETRGNLYLLFDKVEVGYPDENGQEKREEVKDGKWTKTVTYKKTLTGYVKFYFTKPASLNVDGLPYEKYEKVVKCVPSSMLDGVTVLYSDGTKSAPTEFSSVSVSTTETSVTVAKKKLLDYFSIFKDEEKVMSIMIEV